MFDADERETHISTSDIDNEWVVFTRQRKIINKLTKLGYEMFNVELEDGKVVSCEFHLNLNKITFKNAIVNKRIYTDEERAAIAERLSKNRK